MFDLNLAACVGADPEDFFLVGDYHAPANAGRLAAARALCADCPVRLDCAAMACDAGLDDGVFGGLTPPERRARRAAARRTAVAARAPQRRSRPAVRPAA